MSQRPITVFDRTRPEAPALHPLRFRAALARFLLLALPFGFATPARAQDPVFVHDAWSVRDGLPTGSCQSLLQSRDGYLWLGTDDGIVRFDGLRFRVFGRENTPTLRSDRIQGMCEGRDGTLWFVDATGAVGAFRDGAAIDFAPDSILGAGRARRLEMAGDGTLWVSTSRGLIRHRAGRWEAVRSPALARGTLIVSSDRAGGAWASTPAGCVHVLAGGGVKEYVLRAGPDDRGWWQPFVDRQGRVWLATRTGLARLAGDAFVPANEPGLPPAEPWRVFHDDPGTPYPTVQGMYAFAHHHGDAWHVTRTGAVSFGRTDPAFEGSHVWYAIGQEVHRDDAVIFRAPSVVTALLRDREGNVWFATDTNGLFRLRVTPVDVVAGRRDSVNRRVFALAAGSDGTVWLGTRGDGLLGYRGRPGALAPPTLRGAPMPTTLYSVLADSAGDLLVGSGTGLLRFTGAGGNAFVAARVPEVGGQVSALVRDAAGDVWAGSDAGVLVRHAGIWRALALPRAQRDAAVAALRQDALGRMWIAFDGGGVLLLDGDTVTPAPVGRGGLPTAEALALAPAGPDAMWVGLADEGLARITWPRGGRPTIATLDRADGLSDDTIVSLLVDGDLVWMGTQHGLAAVPARALAGRLAGGPRVAASVFDEADGMYARTCTSPALRAPDGRLWFGTDNGAVVVDPARALAAPPPPPAVLEELSTPGRTLELSGGDVRLPANERSFVVRFTALAFQGGAHLRFRYRLEGVDPDWVDAGERREAAYGNVPPGRHRFAVQAGDRLGRWNAAVATRTIDVAPAWHETWAFRLFAALALLALGVLAYRWRLRRYARRQAELAALVRARTAELEQALGTVAAQTRSLEDLDRAKSRFFANVSHEFRTPLTLTLGPLEDVLSGATGELPGEARTELEVALRNSRRLLRLVNEILDLAKLESGRLTLAVREADLREALAEWAQAFVPLAERRRMRFDVRLGDAPLRVWFDPERLGKAVTNLLANAFKFGPEGSTVTLSAARAGEEVRIEVRDEGPGIPAAERERIFERFYQVDGMRRRVTTGTGIGLALARELVEAHGGRITVESAEGEGATFAIVLRTGRAHLADAQVAGPDDAAAPPAPPLLAPEEAEEAFAAPAPEAAPAGDDDRTTVLVVDDNAELRALVRRGLVGRYRVVEAADGQAALALARTAPPDLVVSDVMMPGMDGFELVAAFRSDPELDFIPIVLLTARAEAEDRITGLRTGADDYVEKPFRADELGARVDNLLAMRQRLRARFAATAPTAPPPFRVESQAAPPPADRGDRAWVEQLRRVIGERLGDEDFNVQALADAMRLDRTQLFRRTRELLGEAPADLLRAARLERAAELLRAGEGGVGEIAYATGFRSVAHFSAAFRKRFGRTPTAFAREEKSPR